MKTPLHLLGLPGRRSLPSGGVNGLQLLHHGFDGRTAVPQVSLELTVAGFVNLMQQMLVMFLQEFPEKLFFVLGQPQHHGDLHTFIVLS